MKKIIALLLALVMCLGLFAACVQEPASTTAPKTATVEEANAYLAAMYKDASEAVTRDFDRVAVVMINGVKFSVTWTADVAEDKVKITATETMATIDINEETSEEYSFVLTATVKAADGKTATTTFKHTVKVTKVEVEEGKVVISFPKENKYMTAIDFLYTSSSGSQKHELELTDNKAAAAVLTVRENDDKSVTFIAEDGKFLFCDGSNVQFVAEEGEFTKFFLEATEGGQFIRSNALYNNDPAKPQYLEVYNGYMTCYGMNAEKADIYTFVLETVSTVSQSAILDAAYALPEGESLDGTFTLTGEIIKIDTPWSDQYNNITVTIVCDGDTARPMMCYRLKGDGAKGLAIGDVITVTGSIKNYNGTVEFDAGCTLIAGGKEDEGGNEEVNPPADEPAYVTTPEIGKAYKLGLFQEQKGEVNYFIGSMNGYYGGTSTNKADGIEVMLEDAGDGKYYITFTVGGAKKYVGTEVNGTHLNFKIMDEANRATFTWNAEHATFTTIMSDGTEAFMGTYGSYYTIGMSALEKLETSYPVHLYN